MGVVNQSSQSNTGTCTLTATAQPMVTWNLTYLSVSQSGAVSGTNAKVTVYDGAVGGTVIFAAFVGGPETYENTGIGSVGVIREIPLPKDARGLPALQSTPGNAMNVQLIGTGANTVIINARFTDGLS